MNHEINNIKGFNDLSKFIIEKLNKAGYFVNDIPEDEVIYHYTNWKIAQNILKNEYHIHSSTSMNDSTEQQYTYNLFAKRMKVLFPENEYAAWLEDCNDNIKQDFLDYYIWSFSENGNNQALFGNYTEKDDGVNLGFKANQLFQDLCRDYASDVNVKEGMKNKQTTVQFVKCIYDDKLKQELISKIVYYFVQAYFLIRNGDQLGNEILVDCRRNTAFCSLLFKDASLYQEEETRIIMVQSNINRVNLFSGVDKNRPYLEFPVNNYSNILDCVTLRSRSKLNINDVNEFLGANGYDMCAINSILQY
ncbi:hypothetical protein [Companilactobacillus muriivasis]|uniref:hypothetical protein n=1 Tax=Companilactobacillus muriivasis TaxID=3081444 RepID=UPI0030C6B3E8